MRSEWSGICRASALSSHLAARERESLSFGVGAYLVGCSGKGNSGLWRLGDALLFEDGCT